jgi:hypothetical protein
MYSKNHSNTELFVRMHGVFIRMYKYSFGIQNIRIPGIRVLFGYYSRMPKSEKSTFERMLFARMIRYAAENILN